MQYTVAIIALCVLLKLTTGARILALHGTDLNSHFRVFSGFIEHIASNHEITFYLDAKFKYKGPENVAVRYIDAPSRTENFNMAQLFANPCDIDSYKLFYNHILTVNQSYYESIFETNDASQLLHSNETYDLLIVAGYGAEHFYQFAHTLNIPLVQVTPSQLLPWHSKAVNNPYSWINDFSFMVPESTDTFLGRLKKFVKNALINYRYFWGHMSAMNGATKKFFPPGTPTIEEMTKKTHLIFVNTHNVLGYTRPNVPTVVEIGGLHIKPSKPLPSDLEEFISESNEHGFIYFSLGSLIQPSALKESVRKSIINVFKKLPQKVLWKWNGEMPDAPSNVKISKWFPQGDILAHDKLKLFISQGGMLSTQEAVYHGVPLLIFPVIFDQYNNAFLIEKRGSGKTISFCHFTEELFERYVKDLIHNKIYSERAAEMSQAMIHQNRDLKQRINWWIDFVLEHKGTSMLRPLLPYDSWTDMPIDILSFFVFITVSLLYLFSYLFVYLYKYFVTTNTECKLKKA